MSIDLIGTLKEELAAFGGFCDVDLSIPVPSCPSWSMYDLINHVGRGTGRAAAAITQQRRDGWPDDAPHDPGQLRTWLARQAAAFLDAATGAAEYDPAWTFFPPRTVGFWRRRRCFETIVHRWDAENALGIRPALDPELCSAGISEVFDTMALRQIQLGHAAVPENAAAIMATDTGDSWVFGTGEPVARLAGTAPDLFLALWGRREMKGDTGSWDGDREKGLNVLRGPLVG